VNGDCKPRFQGEQEQTNRVGATGDRHVDVLGWRREVALRQEC